MTFYFKNFPRVEYDIEQTGVYQLITNPTVRFTLRQSLENKAAVYYTYSVKDGERPDVIADKYYQDASLDWILFLINDIIDPWFDWPLSQQDLIKYIRNRYGSVPAAQAQVHTYSKIVQPSQQRIDGTFIEEMIVNIDAATYNTLPPSERRLVTAYDHELQLNDQRREIKVLDQQFVPGLVREMERIFNG